MRSKQTVDRCRRASAGRILLLWALLVSVSLFAVTRSLVQFRQWSTPTYASKVQSTLVNSTSTNSASGRSSTGSAHGQFMVLDPTKTFLVNTVTNKPVFMTGDAPQQLMVQVNQADVVTYLNDRVARGFNVLWVYPVDKTDQKGAPANFYGQPPFSGADFTNENEPYWQNVDYAVQQAQALGITLVMDPSFVGLTPGTGYLSSLLTSSDAVMTAYGAWLGNRYKGYPNIIWSIGGDADYTISGLDTKLADLATGIKSADSAHLMTFEASVLTGCATSCVFVPTGGLSSLDVWSPAPTFPPPPSWLDLNWNYAPNQATGPAGVQTDCARNYAKTPFLPPFQGEDWYEGDQHGIYFLTPLQLREEGYWEVLSGCYLGRLFGNNALWSMGGPGDTMGQTWQSQLSSPGSLGQEYLGKLMRSREHWLMVPDTAHTVLTAGYGSGTTLSVASRTKDGQTIIAYIPNGNATTITINMAKIMSSSSAAKAWWYNPRTAAATLIGSYANKGWRPFTAPDGNDWVLVIDDSGAKLVPPGAAS